MNKRNWERLEKILDSFSIKPLVGIIPHNEDSKTIVESDDLLFWAKTKIWQNKGWILALHGYDHCYVSNTGGINPIHQRSEFAGVGLDIQKEKIKKGYEIFKSNGLVPEVFYAPSHTFDEDTITAIVDETPIRIISDTIAFTPYSYKGITFIPQQVGQFRSIPFSGDFTFCFHPNNMEDQDFERFQHFIVQNRNKFHDFGDLIKKPSNRKRNFLEMVLQQAYYLLHRIKE